MLTKGSLFILHSIQSLYTTRLKVHSASFVFYVVFYDNKNTLWNLKHLSVFHNLQPGALIDCVVCKVNLIRDRVQPIISFMWVPIEMGEEYLLSIADSSPTCNNASWLEPIGPPSICQLSYLGFPLVDDSYEGMILLASCWRIDYFQNERRRWFVLEM